MAGPSAPVSSCAAAVNRPAQRASCRTTVTGPDRRPSGSDAVTQSPGDVMFALPWPVVWDAHTTAPAGNWFHLHQEDAALTPRGARAPDRWPAPAARGGRRPGRRPPATRGGRLRT